MALSTFLDIFYRDGQGRDRTLTFRIKPLALAAAQTLPAAAKIEAVIDAIFTVADSVSNGLVTAYAIRVHEDTPGTTGGNGTSPTSEAARVRNDLNGIPGNWLWTVGCLNKNAVSFDPTNPNSISTSDSQWDAIRAALADAAIAVSDPQGAYAATDEGDIAMVASVFDGRSSPARPR